MNSCKKIVDDATETVDSAQDFAQDQTAISSVFDLVQDIAGTQSFMAKKGNTIIPSSVLIDYLDTTLLDGNGIDIWVDFGDGVECNDGWTRSGLYRITSNKKRFSEVGSEINLSTYESVRVYREGSEEEVYKLYIVPSYGYSLKVTRTAEDVLVIDYSVGFQFGIGSSSDWATFSGKYTVTQTEGSNTPGTLGDVYKTEGACSAVSHKKKPYTVTISEGLVRRVDDACSKTFTKGSMELKNDGAKTSLKLNFGDGTCDNQVEITTPGGVKRTYTVK